MVNVGTLVLFLTLEEMLSIFQNKIKCFTIFLLNFMANSTFIRPYYSYVKSREVKSKGEKEGNKHLNAEFQTKARREKKAFLSNQSKEIEENNRLPKTREIFEKIRDIKGTFYAKMGLIKDRMEWT